MGRRSSGQVLIGAATLMLVILLTMAASLPVINTSIDPSSSVYNLARFVVNQAVDELVTRMSAYQCAKALYYADNRHQYIDFTRYANDIEDRIKNSLIQVASKSYNLELKGVRVAIPVAKITIMSTKWDGNPTSASAGKVEISMAVHVSVSFEYRTKNSKSDFQTYVAYYEEYLTIKGEGGVIQKAPWQGLPWVEFALGFVPVVGGLTGNIEGVEFALPMRVTHYKAVFDQRRVYPWVEPDDLTKSMELVMLKPRDKVKRFGGRAPDEKWFETIRWVEYNKIDWAAIAIGEAIDLIPVGKILKMTKKLKQDTTTEDSETLYISIGPIGGGGSDPLRPLKTAAEKLKESGQVVKEVQQTAESKINLGKPKDYNDWLQWLEYQRLTDDERKALAGKVKELFDMAIKEGLSDKASAQKYYSARWANALGDFLDEELPADIEGTELYQSTTGSDKIMAYLANNNPLVWVGIPLHNGNSLFGVCVWLIGAYYPGDA